MCRPLRNRKCCGLSRPQRSSTLRVQSCTRSCTGSLVLHGRRLSTINSYISQDTSIINRLVCVEPSAEQNFNLLASSILRHSSNIIGFVGGGAGGIRNNSTTRSGIGVGSVGFAGGFDDCGCSCVGEGSCYRNSSFGA